MTTITEKTVQEGVQTFLQSIAAFAGAHTVINDFAWQDKSLTGLPMAVIITADNFRYTKPTATRNDFLEVPVALYEAFVVGSGAAGLGWKKTQDNFRDNRQKIVDQAFTGPNSTVSIAGLRIVQIRNEGPVDSLFNPKLSEAQLKDAMPIMMFQTIILSLESF